MAKVVREGYEGAEILGVHFEGPYLDMKYKGAQPEQYIVKPTVEQFRKYQEAAEGLIKYITMATEQDDDFALTRYCSENGVVVSIGHSAATSKQAVQAFAHGARSMTHVYNGMTPFNHRANGLVGAAYRMKSMYGEIICDGNHSTPAALRMFFDAKGPHYGIMVSDALMAKGSPVGSKFIFGGNEIEIYEDGSAHLTSSKGLAGSTLRSLTTGCSILIEEALGSDGYSDQFLHEEPGGVPAHRRQERARSRSGWTRIWLSWTGTIKVLQTYCRGRAMLGE